MKLLIKNMVCDRCIMVVRELLEKLGLQPLEVKLGEADIAAEHLDAAQLEHLAESLRGLGFELIEDRRSRLAEQVKTAVIELVHRGGTDNLKHSEYLAQRTGIDYAQLSKAFTETAGTTIEQYIIQQKIERVKELLSYGEMTLSEIAWEMDYSSVAALSNQFKKVTGMTPSAWKAADEKSRKALHDIGQPKL